MDQAVADRGIVASRSIGSRAYEEESAKVSSLLDHLKRIKKKLWKRSHAESHRKSSALWYKKNPERAKETRKKWSAAHPDEMREYKKTWRALGKEQKRLRVKKCRTKYLSIEENRKRRNRATVDSSRKARFGLTREQYDLMVVAQAGCCAVCKMPPTIKHKGTVVALCVDHDHLTGKIRGLLCRACNVALGYLRDSAAICSNAVEYLVKHGR